MCSSLASKPSPTNFRQMDCAIEVRNAITADNLAPGLREHFLTVFAVDLLPDKELGGFCVQNETIKIEEKGFDLHIAAILSEL
jgi:hypothetical protein